MSSSPCYLDPIILPLIKGPTVLDVACGYGRWGQLIQTNFWEAGLSQPPVVDGIDGFEPNVSRCAALGVYRTVSFHLLPALLTGKWSTVLACEIIEHLPESMIASAIDSLEAVAEKRIIFSTPNWNYLREGGETLEGFNELEAHLSYVPRSYFEKRGYTIIAAGYGNPRNFVVRILNRLRLRSGRLTRILPELHASFAAAYIAYKDI